MLFLTTQLFAQGNMKVAEMHNQKWEFIVKKANISDQQAEKIKPAFLEYEAGVWKLMETQRSDYHKFRDNFSSKVGADYEKLNEQYVIVEVQKARLLENYYFRLKKQLPAEIIFNYFSAERSFRKELIKNWEGKGSANRRK
jgi:hypothetical protein